jgi:hypothetical protein
MDKWDRKNETMKERTAEHKGEKEIQGKGRKGVITTGKEKGRKLVKKIETERENERKIEKEKGNVKRVWMKERVMGERGPGD